MHRRLFTLLLTVAPITIACGESAADDDGDTSSTANTICVWEETFCLGSLSQGETAGPYGACPPEDRRYEEKCTPTTLKGCASQNRAPYRFSTSAPLMRYIRNMRFYASIRTCDDYRGGATAEAETICSGVCEGP
jgi:hypothetical protein